MTLRLYWPKPEALDGTWKQPRVQRVKEDSREEIFGRNGSPGQRADLAPFERSPVAARHLLAKSAYGT
jgi:hypothetical protein